MTSSFEVVAVEKVESPLTDPQAAPKQGDEGAPDAWLVFETQFLPALEGVRVGDRMIVITWLDRAQRDTLRVHPRGDLSRPQRGVFATRSPHRPNPIGLHPVDILNVERDRVQVSNLEAVDGTPVIDLKPVIDPIVSSR